MASKEDEDTIFRRNNDLKKPENHVAIGVNQIYKNQLKLQETQNLILRKLGNGMQDFMKQNRKIANGNKKTINKLMWAIGGVLVGVIATMATLIIFIVT